MLQNQVSFPQKIQDNTIQKVRFYVCQLCYKTQVDFFKVQKLSQLKKRNLQD